MRVNFWVFHTVSSFQAVWVDDAFMGTALLSELAYHTQNVTYAQQAAEDVLRLQGTVWKNKKITLTLKKFVKTTISAI